MKKTLFFILFALIPNLAFSQEAKILKIQDTRSIADGTSLIKAGIRADFKIRAILGVPGLGIYSSNITIAPWFDSSGGLNYQLNFNEGGIYYRQGSFIESTWRPWQRLMIVNADGSISGKFEVNGTIRAREVKIEATGWPDFVFDSDYRLPSLKEVEQHINQTRHLPEMPSLKEVMEQGQNIGDIQAKLLQKIEELTLYVINQDKEIQKLKVENESIKAKLK